ncbi:Aste57867_8464 [Aphanomyces stellatus]|uniref:Aste57867_8464 protein n=1 Tax=Aphanomyces stellatus TaxID=120398 RepID=A0A485KKE9_9STRA|nr:hypothetical protein As57867_008432 [Aphanomyces stellatus]VFT85350.1 Aste57867_8464 [Aphanomyces stellatus]
MAMIKTGTLFKKGAGGGLFQRQNWKPRYFKLTKDALFYYDYDSGMQKGTIDLTSCGRKALEVMPADSKKTGRSESSEWRLAINTPGRRWLLAAESEEEMHAWVQAIDGVLAANDIARQSMRM